MDNTLKGSLLGIKLNGVYYRCQTDASFEFTADTTEDEACKPDFSQTNEDPVGWKTRSVDAKDWTCSFSAKQFADALAASQVDAVEFFIDSDLAVEVNFATNPGVNKGQEDILIVGTGIMNGLTLNAPQTGSATYDVQVQGNGKPTITRLPKTT